MLKPILALCTVIILTAAGPAWAQTKADLKYAFKAGDSYVYKVEIKADTGDEIRILSGHPDFRVQSIDGGNARLLLSNPSLSERTERKPGARPTFGPPRFPSMRFPRSPFDFTGHELVLNERGQVVSERGQSQITYMLGHLSKLIFEPFPDEPKETWSFTERQTISITSQSRFPRPFREDNEIERLNAEETTTYTVAEATADVVKIKREQTLKAIEKAGDGPRLELAIAGTYLFSPKSGLPESVSYQGHVVSRETNTTTRIPLTVEIKRLKPEELEEVRQKQAQALAEAKARQEAQAAERKRPLTADERGTLLSGLASGDKNKIRESLQKLKDKEPPEADQELAAAIVPHLASDDLFLRQWSAEALEKWATSEEVPALVKALDDKHIFVTHAVLRALGKLQDPVAFPAMVAKADELGVRNQVMQALKAAGPAAEKDVLALLAHNDWQVRMEACNVLAEIGGEASKRQLQTAANDDSNALVKSRAQAALDAIGKRGK
jgi:hypothetical protein